LKVTSGNRKFKDPIEGKRKAPEAESSSGEDGQGPTSKYLSKEIGSSQRRFCILATITIHA
jgi:hypothetical protein